jgi:hypothetical protein
MLTVTVRRRKQLLIGVERRARILKPDLQACSVVRKSCEDNRATMQRE